MQCGLNAKKPDAIAYRPMQKTIGNFLYWPFAVSTLKPTSSVADPIKGEGDAEMDYPSPA